MPIRIGFRRSRNFNRRAISDRPYESCRLCL